MTRDEWQAKGERLFGKDIKTWRFKCPSCGHIASVQDYLDAKAPNGCIAFSCIGRFLDNPSEAFIKGAGPCNFAGGGLIGLNPVLVGGSHYFEFAPLDIKEKVEA